MNTFLPVSREDLSERGWDGLDIILITGDSYVDHPSFGVALIGRVLEHRGFKVGIIAQPDWRRPDDFARLGRPKLFFGITAGNLDSMVANYTANKRPRKKDLYSPGGEAGARPDRATIVYANRVREVFDDVPIVLGGIEASLRRFAHYDWWDNKVRRSILLDSRADIIVYGMGETQIHEIAERMRAGKEITGIRGTVIVSKESNLPEARAEIPGFDEVKEEKEAFNRAFKMMYENMDPYRGKAVVQKHGTRYVVQFLPAKPLSVSELDALYRLPYARRWHPVYSRSGGVPALETVRFSLTSHRGCCGECSFCSLSMHQGRIVRSRSVESLVSEASRIASSEDFKGTITDMGGPTANLYGAWCSRWEGKRGCLRKRCLVPEKCGNLKMGYGEALKAYEAILALPKVKHLFIESGMRYDLLVTPGSEKYLEAVCLRHVSGRMKVAPEHTSETVLKIMNKPGLAVYEAFVAIYGEVNRRVKKKQFLVNYFIIGHPGTNLENTLELALYLQGKHMRPEQIQDYIPLPLTLAGTIFHTGRHPFTGEEIYVARTLRERKMQRALVQSFSAENKELVREALHVMKKDHLFDRLTGGGPPS